VSFNALRSLPQGNLQKRKKLSKPKDSGQAPLAIPNLILGLAVSAPHQVWVKDFT